MARKLILAVAGSGKTSHLIDQLDENSRVLVVTYTINNYNNIRRRVAHKFGYMPGGIAIFTYFGFLYSFCYKPFCQMELGTKGIIFDPCPTRYAQGLDRYIDRNGRLYSNRVAKLLAEADLVPDIKARITKYFDHVMIDEVQDLAGHDFNLLCELVATGPDVTLVGDFYQHTFDTSRDGNVNRNLHSEIGSYKDKFANAGLDVEVDLLARSYRSSPSVCRFVTDHLGIAIHSHRDDPTPISLVQDRDEAERIFENGAIAKLFYRDSRKYQCRSANWGEVKGDDHHNAVCVVLNRTTFQAYEGGTLAELAPQTKNKLYVAITRAREDLYFVPETLYRHHKNP